MDEIYAITSPGVEPVLVAECRALGFEVLGSEAGGVTLTGRLEDVWRANLELRVANRVLVRAASFRARLFPELERHARHIPWGRYLAPGAPVRFRVTSRKSRLYHEDAIAERLAEAAGAAVGAVPAPGGADDGTAPPSQLFVVRVVRDEFVIRADSSGELLHRRGYRQAAAKAPLRETLAAAMLLAAEWDGVAPFLDPFCGSGTIPIEAALLARRIAPGLARRFAFERWPGFDSETWHRMLDQARDRVRPRGAGAILGSDRDAGAVAMAIANAERAGVGGDIEFERRAVSTLPQMPEPAWVVTNPPYGRRVGDHRALRDLFARFGAVLRERCPGAQLGVLIARPEHLKAVDLPLEEAFRTTNGGIPVRFLTGRVPGKPDGPTPGSADRG